MFEFKKPPPGRGANPALLGQPVRCAPSKDVPKVVYRSGWREYIANRKEGRGSTAAQFADGVPPDNWAWLVEHEDGTKAVYAQEELSAVEGEGSG